MRGFERGKHGEVSGNARRRNKGESVGGELYKAFGKYGFISDIFILRKARQRSQGPFAFIRYVAHGGAVKAVEMMNNKKWENERLLVTISKYRQRVAVDRGRQSGSTGDEAKRRIVQKWVVNKTNSNDANLEVCRDKKQAVLPQRKTIQAEWDVDQKQRLERSLLGVCVKPIELRKIMYFLLEEWKGPWVIEVRDVGPYRCLITFSSPEIRNEVVESQLLQSVFDEVRFHWDIFWSLSRRVWIEVTRMPIGLWNVKNFNKIAELWGKVIRFDDRAEEAKSFSTARILIDSFQWEMIHEWVNVTVDDRQFEVFVKEFGFEIYRIQSHLDREEGNSDWSEEAEGDSQRNMSTVRVPPVEIEETPMTSKLNNLNLIYVGDPVIETIINRPFNVLSDMWDGDNDDSGMSTTKREKETCLDERRVVESTGFGLGSRSDVQNLVVGSASTSTCPFPPEFGPCSSGQHVHRQSRAPMKTYSQILVRETLQSEPEEASSNCNSNPRRTSVGVESITGGVEHDVVADSKGKDCVQALDEQRDGGILTPRADANKDVGEVLLINNVEGEEPSIESEERSDETLYQLTEKAIRGLADSEEVQNTNVDSGLIGGVNWQDLREEGEIGEWSDKNGEWTDDIEGTHEDIDTAEIEEGLGEETLCRINLFNHKPGVPRSEDGVFDHGENEVSSANSAYLSDETLYRINSNFKNEQRRVEGENSEFESEGVVEEERDSIEEG
ncbi:hypothetical protein PIB30_032017 [Stylosanthes scabra]|uniref:RRM domain-containing protein n=1 Tax=Stylosanthes scabra TaxID=79078 RepID=A0ABU6WE70_9FABA|nr:hypothetical protein [Stylosanthes scabra]